LRVEVPTGAAAAASFAKCLCDGVVSALQAHNGWRNADIGAWMSGRFGFHRAEVERLVADRDSAVLGTRRLFNARAGGFQWSPDDDFCVAGEIELICSTNRTGFRLEGKLYTVATK
jgi:hypothetical protein